MIPEPARLPEKKDLPIQGGSRNIAPHVAHLVISNLKDISPTWWAEINNMLSSKSVADRKFAITEINKIQLKSMPNQISAEEGVNINVNIVNYGKPDNNPTQFHTESIPGTVVEGDG